MEIHELTLDENVKINSEGTISEVDWKWIQLNTSTSVANKLDSTKEESSFFQ